MFNNVSRLCPDLWVFPRYVWKVVYSWSSPDPSSFFGQLALVERWLRESLRATPRICSHHRTRIRVCTVWHFAFRVPICILILMCENCRQGSLQICSSTIALRVKRSVRFGQSESHGGHLILFSFFFRKLELTINDEKTQLNCVKSRMNYDVVLLKRKSAREFCTFVHHGSRVGSWAVLEEVHSSLARPLPEGEEPKQPFGPFPFRWQMMQAVVA